MHKRHTNKIILFLKRVIKSIKNFQDLFKLLEALVSLIFFYFTRKKLPIM
jgi:hypothetical protein